jgi:hypothetical protein
MLKRFSHRVADPVVFSIVCIFVAEVVPPAVLNPREWPNDLKASNQNSLQKCNTHKN